MTATINGAPVLEQVRAALETRAPGSPAPGRRVLARELGLSEARVRRALDELRNRRDLRVDPGDPPSDPGDDPGARAGDGHPVERPADEPATTATIPAIPLDDSPAHPGDIRDDPGSPAGEPGTARAIPGENPGDPAPARVGGRQSTWVLIVIGLSASVAVWSGWVELGRLTGFGQVRLLPGIWDGLTLDTAVTLPLGIEAYGGYALRTWLSSAGLSARTRRYARWSAWASLAVGAGAQVAAHVMRAQGVVVAPVWVTVVVSCVPVVVLGLATGLATLVRRDAAG